MVGLGSLRVLVAVALAISAATSAACGGAKSSKTAPTTTRKAPATTAPVEQREAALTGFGATDEAWNQNHDEDSRFEAGSSYDPDPSLGDGERFNDRYYSVIHGDGRVLGYSMRFPSQTGVEEAKSMMLASEFPSDAKIAWFKRLNSCAQMFVQSRTVARAVNAGALVEFSSGAAGDHYAPSNVSEAILIALPAPAKGNGC
ncbi:MAG TPA: hypothetical protein VK488_05390 [Gaiellaceae bacterium]|nr:hypothetical protein [Gaiellaceae bacterium]